MPLIDFVFEVCQRLETRGWRQYLLKVSDLNIGQANAAELARELARPLARIDRGAPGFQDFALEGHRGIEPGQPAHSLLYHALAAPGLGHGEVDDFPTADEIDIVENYVYGVQPPSIADLLVRAGGAPLAIVVYAVQYRQAIATVHQNHADFCYARTGLARVGTSPAHYDAMARGYHSLSPSFGAVYAIPCRYAAYIAAHLKGDQGSFGPLRFREGGVDAEGDPVKPDSQRLFWVPLHKLFSGSECVRNRNLNLQFVTQHHNQKLRRIHLYLQTRGFATRYAGDVLEQFPFVIPEDELVSKHQSAGSILIAPQPHPLVQEALVEGVPITFPVPPGGATASGSFRIPSLASGARPASEYVYVRQQVLERGGKRDLNQDPDLVRTINIGKYQAQHYLDHSGDGWIQALCDGLALDIPQSLPAYSVVTAPHPYPEVAVEDFFDWWKQSAPPDVRAALFPEFQGPLPPEPLSDARITANISFRQTANISISVPVFTSNDDSYTAIISRLGAGSDAPTRVTHTTFHRVSPLPDNASGLFAPGWDISIDFGSDENSPNGVLHLANYGAGSPFLEDTRLCTAESAFWPAIAPDQTRVYNPGNYPTVTPIPQSRLGWDGLPAPQLIGPGEARFVNLAYSDYVQQALLQGFDFAKIGSTTTVEYQTWSLLMARVYETIGATDTLSQIKWAVLDFDLAPLDDPELATAQTVTGITLDTPYRFYMILPQSAVPLADTPAVVRTVFQRSVLAFATPQYVLYLDSWSAGWQRRAFQL